MPGIDVHAPLFAPQLIAAIQSRRPGHRRRLPPRRGRQGGARLRFYRPSKGAAVLPRPSSESGGAPQVDGTSRRSRPIRIVATWPDIFGSGLPPPTPVSAWHRMLNDPLRNGPAAQRRPLFPDFVRARLTDAGLRVSRLERTAACQSDRRSSSSSNIDERETSGRVPASIAFWPQNPMRRAPCLSSSPGQGRAPRTRPPQKVRAPSPRSRFIHHDPRSALCSPA